jgi:tetratricopeptide (TPR) repeat protein
MLAPVIGLVQAGPFSIADRYAYLSNAGLFIMVVWALRGNGRALIAGGALVLAGCMAATLVQVRYWKDSETLFGHTLAVTTDNGIIESDLGKVLFQKGRADEALPHLLRAVALRPDLALAHYNLGHVYLAAGRVAEALSQFDIQVHLDPRDPVAQYNFGGVLLNQGLVADAISHLQQAVQLRPGAADFHCKLGQAFRQAGRAAEAISQYEQALQILPTYLQAASSLAWMLASNPDPSLRNGSKAVQLGLLADQISGGQDPKILGVLAAAYAEKGDFSKAVATAQRALQLAGPENSALTKVLQDQLALYHTGSPVRDIVPPSSSPEHTP